MRACDKPDCDNPIAVRAYASYNADEGQNAHPLHARYPMPMVRACAAHLIELLADDYERPGSTRQWLIVLPDQDAS